MTPIFAHWQEELHLLAQAIGAVLLGGLLGWEREAAGKYAGLRTHMLVCLASMLFVRLGQMLIADMAAQFPGLTIRADPVHVIAAIATGISFIGAGVIFRDPNHEKAQGLTTAASLLVTGSIGGAIGLDRYITAMGIVALTLLVLHTLRKFAERLRPHEGAPEDKQPPH